MLNQQVINSFISIVGRDNTIINEKNLTNAEKTNYNTTEKILLIVKPASVQEVKECVLLANKNKIALHPISKGKNWGYGSRVPVNNNTVLIELDRINKILDYDEKMGYITVQPGVTFQQAFNFLREKKSSLILSITGGGTNSSLLANALDRGIATGLYADRFSHICNLEVVLPTGDIICTGMGRFGEIKSSQLYRWGLGPSLDGLFSQSNFGIVTKMTIWLMHCPNYFQILFYKLNSDKKLPSLISASHNLLMSGLVRPAITIYNDFRIISTIAQYPMNKCNPKTSSLDEVLNNIRVVNKNADIASKWNGEISIRGESKEHIEIQSKLIIDILKNKTDSITISEMCKDEILETLKNHYENKAQNNEENFLKNYLMRKYIGIPSDLAIRQLYWRKRTPMPAILNPDLDGCGMIWICPIVPFNGDDIKKVVAIINKCSKKYFFEPAISLQCLTERAINIIASITWDRKIMEEDSLAEQCYTEMTTLLNKKGYFVYRDTTKGMKIKQKGIDVTDPYYSFLNTIKKAIDPNSILSPGRYNIG